MKSKIIRLLCILFLLGLNIGCDQATKFVAKKNLDKHRTYYVVRSLFILKCAENDGAFLSFGTNFPEAIKSHVLTVLPTAAIAVTLVLLLYYSVWKNQVRRMTVFSLCCILGGGAGNMYDRITNNGRVFDFMNFGIGGLRTGILNFADLSITLGVVILLVGQFQASRRPK